MNHVYMFVYLFINIYTHTQRRIPLVYACIHIHIYIRLSIYTYGVATISRLLTIIGLFCKRALSKRLYSAKETYYFKEPTNRSHPIYVCTHSARYASRLCVCNIYIHAAPATSHVDVCIHISTCIYTQTHSVCYASRSCAQKCQTCAYIYGVATISRLLKS